MKGEKTMQLKTFGILTTTIIMGMGAANANPIWDIYMGATVGAGGVTIFADNNDKTYASQTFGAMFGIDIPAFRFEGEYNYLRASDFNTNLAMVNAYFKMPSTVIKPYLGLGVGASFSGDYDVKDIKSSMKTTAAYQGMLGLTMDLPALPLKFDIEGRVLYAPDIFSKFDVKPDLLHYDARLKLRYVF